MARATLHFEVPISDDNPGAAHISEEAFRLQMEGQKLLMAMCARAKAEGKLTDWNTIARRTIK